jgi:hypothetical protein
MGDIQVQNCRTPLNEGYHIKLDKGEVLNEKDVKITRNVEDLVFYKNRTVPHKPRLDLHIAPLQQDRN